MIESVNNEKIKVYSKLNDKKYRQKEGLFIVEGKHLVEEAIKNDLIKEIFILDGEDNPYNATIVSESVMKKLSELTNPPKVLAICKTKTNDEIKGNIIMLDDISDPGNLGTIIRSAVAFNYETIILSPNTVDIYNSKVIRATEGMLFNINIITGALNEYLDKLSMMNYEIYGTDVEHGAVPQKTSKKHVIIIGSEAKGMHEEYKNKCNSLLKINMNKNCESLNAGVSASILMYELGGK